MQSLPRKETRSKFYLTRLISANLRTNKLKCNGAEPQCDQCRLRSLTCVYRVPPKSVDSTIKVQKQLDVLQNSFNHYADIVDQLKTLPERDALKLLQRLRSSADVAGAFSSLQGSLQTRVRLSDHKTSQALLPTTSSRIEFELTARHGIVYPTLLPIDIASLNISPLDKPASPPSSHSSESGSLVSRKTSSTPIELSSAGLKPYCDSRLKDLDISYWSKVPISDESAATLISLYLETDQTIVGFIDADLFVQSLVDRVPKFCSTFLVTAMLYVACVSDLYKCILLESI